MVLLFRENHSNSHPVTLLLLISSKLGNLRTHLLLTLNTPHLRTCKSLHVINQGPMIDFFARYTTNTSIGLPVPLD